MKKAFILAGLMAMLVFAIAPAQAAVYTFSPSDADLQDLSHNYFYDWAIQWTATNETIGNATITFHGIRDITPFDPSNDRLFVHLLNNPSLTGTPVGADASRYWDGSSSNSDNWAGMGPLVGIGTVPPIPTTWPGIDLTFNLRDLGLLSDLRTFAADGAFGFGIDPDCHFVNNGITVTVSTPEPGMLLLLGSGLLGAAFFVRRRR